MFDRRIFWKMGFELNEIDLYLQWKLESNRIKSVSVVILAASG